MKIKKILILSMVVILALACATVLFACDRDKGGQSSGGKDNPSVCQHSWMVQESAPTCTNKGYKTTVCELCGEIKSVEEIPALGHEIVEYEGKAATCTEGGWKAYQACTRCSYTTYQAISKLDHSDPIFHPSKPATCTEDGYEAYEECSRCHEIINGEIAVIPALGHDMQHIDRQDSTCTEVGWEAHEACQNPGCNYKENYVEIPIHHYDDDGYCIDCGRSICLDYLEMELNDAGTEYIITGFKENIPANAVIPAKNNGLPITTIKQEIFKNCEIIESVTLGENIKKIGSNAFSNCANLKVVNWNATNCQESSYAFNACSKLTTIAIGSNVQSMPRFVFTSSMYYDGVYITDLEAWCNIKFGDYGDSNPLCVAHNLYLDGELVEDLVIPDGIVKLNKFAFYNCKSIKTVTIPDSVLIIEETAFQLCDNLTDVTIGNGVMSIYDRAFYYCGSLQNVVLGDSVTSIGKEAFYECNLQNVYITDMATFCGIDFEDIYSNPLCTSGYAVKNLYLNGVLVEDLVIPEGVTSIGKFVFYRYIKMKSVTIPSSLTKIGKDAFRDCSGLTKVDIKDVAAWCDVAIFNELTNPLRYAHNLYLDGVLVEDLIIPEGVIEIKPYAFYDCDSIKSVTLPSTLKTVGYMAFNECDNLTDVNITDVGMWCNLSFDNIDTKNSLKHFENLYFNGEPIKDLVIPEGVTIIPTQAFEGCNTITTVTIPSSVKTVQTNAFYKCSALKEVYITDLTAWCNIDFEHIYSTPMFYAAKMYINNVLVEDNLVIPEGVTSIKDCTFFNWKFLKTVTIPEDITSIGEWAFCDCNELTGITIPEGVTSIGDDAFRACSKITSANIPDGVTYLGSSAFYSCSLLQHVTIGKGIKTIGASAFSNCRYLTSIVIPSTVEEIGVSAFYNCTNLTDVTISYGVETIGNHAFENCTALSSIEIPGSVVTIGDYAFYGCDLLQNIKIDKGVEIIGEYAFAKCTTLTKIKTPDSIIEIGSHAFENCKLLMNVTIGYGAKYIGKKAFNKCDNLQYVDFAGSSGWFCSIFGKWGGNMIDVAWDSRAAEYLSSTYVNYCFYKDAK